MFHAKPVKVKRKSPTSKFDDSDSAGGVFHAKGGRGVGGADEVIEDENTKVDVPIDHVSELESGGGYGGSD